MPSTQRTRDAALVLPILGAFLLVSPAASIFNTPATVFGLPLVVLYVFGVWLGLILIAIVLARRLSAAEDRRPPGGRPPEEAPD
jgi:membrane protein implicated in regulation of membrane protease activity